MLIVGAGNATNQLSKPSDLAFDSQGNLYVMDMENNRVQMFALVENQPCSLSHQQVRIEQHFSSNFIFLFVSLVGSSSVNYCSIGIIDTLMI